MAITKEKKDQLLQMYVSLLGDSQAIVFVGSRGLTVAEVTQLRTKIRETGARYHVVKNTLFRRALMQADMPVPEFLVGPTAIAFCVEDIAPVVKAIEDFANDLQEREFERLGGRERIPVDIHLVTATNRDLEAMVERGEFRRDLYYRLNVVELSVPPLAQRRDVCPHQLPHGQASGIVLGAIDAQARRQPRRRSG